MGNYSQHDNKVFKLKQVLNLKTFLNSLLSVPDISFMLTLAIGPE